jgi:flavin-dependent dehydrogenase
MRRDYDLIVIGAGPAGSSAAITAARAGYSVLLLDRGRFPRHKVCGEFVSAESLSLLRWLVGEQYDTLLRDSLLLSEARLFLDGHAISVPVTPPAASIARFDLDFALWSAAAASGVSVLSEAAVQHVSQDSGSIRTSRGDFSARAAINASGRWSNLNKNDSQPSRWLGLKAHFRGQAEDATDLYFFPNGYCGVQPLRAPGGEARVNVCALFRGDPTISWDTLFSRHPVLYDRSRNWTPVFSRLSTFPVKFRAPRPVSGNVLNAGDAACFVDPFAGDGIALALRSGHLAACSLHPFLLGKQSLSAAVGRYATGYNRQFTPVYRASSLFRKLLSLPRQLRTPLLFALRKNPRLGRLLIQFTRSQFSEEILDSTPEEHSAHDQHFPNVVARQEELDGREIAK